jgi:hypothetical protein
LKANGAGAQSMYGGNHPLPHSAWVHTWRMWLKKGSRTSWLATMQAICTNGPSLPMGIPLPTARTNPTCGKINQAPTVCEWLPLQRCARQCLAERYAGLNEPSSIRATRDNGDNN